MKKIIISVIAVLIIASGIICFILFSKDKKLDDSYNIGTVNEKVDIKDNKVSDEVSEINQDKTKEQSIDKSSKSTEKNQNESKTNQKQPEEKNEEKKSDNGNKNNNTKQNTTVVEEQNSKVEKTAWEELGISEYDYYHKPMWSWQRIDYSIDEFKTEQKTKEACLSKGDEYFKQGIGYSCTSVNSYAGTYLGEMLKTF
jgi:hypothetical protein